MIESTVAIRVTRTPGYALITVAGTLDSWTYRDVRDAVIKAALDQHDAVVVDVSGLTAPAITAWAAFTSARWHVSVWPDVPLVLVCDDDAERSRIERSGITRYVPVVSDEVAAASAIGHRAHFRHRARTTLDVSATTVTAARRFVRQCLTAWSCHDATLTASAVVTVLVENVLTHTRSHPVVTVERVEDRVTVAVSDDDPRAAVRHENVDNGAHTVSGLAVVAALSRAWGSIPTAGGKTVWALIGPENRL
ncbi:STAS domain-containing protein [Mycobacterium sp. PSTR-4-N]|uniref:STAS domain-containing protein n=1 Tax=Mycobacterium sp. PSTR-4-N TaxID=2917745 RepID=UPI001F1506B6|nr:STAS domain-containing protein [Mycobacterium sp. PSTR-4-N]MCG7597659.1 sulfate transporter [Mycobacterium sp. PSTR-4-N]